MSSSTRWWALSATALTLLVVGLDMTILNVALPDIARSLHATTSQLQWFADAYLLVVAAVLLPAGMLGDRLGRKELTVGALVVFGIGSAWCAMAAGPGALIAGRAVLGLGAAVLIPLGMSAVVVLFEPAERSRAVVVLSLATMVGLPLGPILGGVLLDHFWWGAVFVVNLPVVVVALVAVLLWLPRSRGEAEGRIDVVGALASAAGLVAVTYGLIEAPTRGFDDPRIVGCLVVGVLLLAGMLWWERRLPSHVVPVFDRAVWDVADFRWGAVCAAAASLTFFGVMFTVPQLIQRVLGTDALGTGLRTLPLVGGMLVAMRVAQAVGSRVAPRVLGAGGSLLVAVAAAIGATTTVSDGFGRLAVWTALAGAGFGVALLSAQTVALVSLPRHRAATGSALLQTLRQVGSVVGIAVLGSLLAVRYSGPGDTAADFVAGTDLALWATVAVALGAAVLAALRLPGRPAGAESGRGDLDELARAA